VFPSIFSFNFKKNELRFKKKLGHESCIHQFLLASFVSSSLIGKKKKKTSLLGLFLSLHLLCIVI
jgi:hypothetical protein